MTKQLTRPILRSVRSFKNSILARPTMRDLTTHPRTIKPTTTEVATGALGPRNLEQAVRAIHEDGLVIVADVMPTEETDVLNKKMVGDAKVLAAKGDKGPFNYNRGNIQQDAPPVLEYFYPSIFMNPIATQITSAVLGPKPTWCFCSGNSAMPSQDAASSLLRQPVHSDADFVHPSHPFALVVNVPLVTMTPENGATEVWLGTQNLGGIDAQEGKHGERASGRIQQALLEQRTQVRGPSQPEVQKGSMIIRDLRLWHAGMPNRAKEVRTMLAMIHFAAWYRNNMRLELAEEIQPLIESQTSLNVPVDWVKKETDLNNYLDKGFGNAYDFSQVD